MSRRRRLDPEERSLWTHVTRSVSPLGKRRREPIADEPEPVAPAKPAPKPRSKVALKPPPVAAAAPPPAPRPQDVPLGRKARRRLARGSDTIDGRLDLHGLTQEQAHRALLGFLRGARGSGARVVLVITGKGVAGDPHGERGVLRRQVLHWLRLPEFRECVIGYETAAIGHGGEGALYVRIKRVS